MEVWYRRRYNYSLREKYTRRKCSKNWIILEIYNTWKVSVFGVFLVRIFPHSDWRRRDTPSPYSVQMWKNSDQKISKYGHFSRSASFFRRFLFIWASFLYYIVMTSSAFNFYKKKLHCRCFSVNFEKFFCKTGVHKNLVMFTGKHLCWALFFIKLQAWRIATLLKRDSSTGVFQYILRNFFRTA